MNTNFRHYLGIGAATLIVVVLATTTSCNDAGTPPPRAAGIGAGGATVDDALQTLFRAAMQNLNRLEDFIRTKEEEPRKVVTALNTSDQRTAFAIIEDNPAIEGEQFDVVRVVSQNARLRINEVQPGDMVRYYANLEEFQNDGNARQLFGKDDYFTFYVGEVLGENRLRLSAPLAAEFPLPVRMEVWRRNDEYLRRVRESLAAYQLQGESSLGWEYSPETPSLEQLLDRLRSWALGQQKQAGDDWSLADLLRDLPEAQRNILAKYQPREKGFLDSDARYLQEAVWLRDVANRVVRGALTDADRVGRLFDWTMRNIQLADDALDAEPLNIVGPVTEKSLQDIERDDAATPEPCWKILLYGRGAAEQRAWVFCLLARQIGVEVVQLAIPNDAGELRPWVAGALIDGDLFLFDCRLESPIPGPDGEGVAALSQVLAEPSLLRGLDLPSTSYDIHEEDIAEITAWVEASPEYASRRMHVLQSNLAGDQRMIVAGDADAAAEKLRKVPGVKTVAPWSLPYRTRELLQDLSEPQRRRTAMRYQGFVATPQPLFWKARVLHIQGDFQSEGAGESAIVYYLDSRPSNRQLALAQPQPSQLYLLRAMKLNASFWLGLIQMEEERWESAVDYFTNHVITQLPDGPLASAAWLRLGESYEQLGETEKAIDAYAKASGGASGPAAALRAARLSGWSSTATPTDEGPQSEESETAPEQEPETQTADINAESDASADDDPGGEQPNASDESEGVTAEPAESEKASDEASSEAAPANDETP